MNACYKDVCIGFGTFKSHNAEHVEREFKIRQKVLTLKCNYNSLKICGALWDNASLPPLL